MDLAGIHHLTAVTADVRTNHRFYTQVLGMRLVKRSVNQDDVSAYHLFYADAVGTPGTDLTFFDWNLPRAERGTRSITRTYLRVNGPGALNFWQERLTASGVRHEGVTEQDGRSILLFEDTEGQRLGLVDDSGLGDDPVTWDRSDVPPEMQIRGLGPIELSVPQLQRTDLLLRHVLLMRPVREYNRLGDTVVVYEMADGGPHAELHVAVQPEVPVARPGAGGVHHLALRTSSEESHSEWLLRLNEFGIANSGKVDRYYFKSLYFREPNGILFEIATDGPGFSVDEDPETLGEKLVLPPFLEPDRDAILANLKPID